MAASAELVPAVGRLEIVRRDEWIPGELRGRMRDWSPRTGLGRVIRDCLRYLPIEMAAELVDRISRVVVLESSLSVVVVRGDGRVEDHGVVSERVVTDTGCAYWVDAWQNIVEMENMKYHGFGTGATAEGAGQTALVTELTTQYAVSNTRPTGTLTENASTVFESVATLSPSGSGSLSIQEHALFSQAAAGGGVMWDRSLTGTQTLTRGADSLQATYRMTATSGG